MKTSLKKLTALLLTLLLALSLAACGGADDDDDTDLTAQIVIRRKWGDVIHYDLNTNEIDG